MLGTGLFAQETLFKSINMLIDETRIENLTLPFAAVACDLKSGKEIIFTKGSLISAVTASSAVPGVIAPLDIDNQLLIDGTVTSTIPIMAARLLSKNTIVAVDVRKNLDEFENPQRGYEVVLRSNEITTRILNDLYLKDADVILKPDVASIKWNEFRTIDLCIQAGEQTVKENLPPLSKKLHKLTFSF
jgi:NTE family protein